MKKLANAEISTLKADVESFKESLLESLYDHYNKIITFTSSDAIKGETGASVFNYFNEVHLYLLNRIMNVTAEITNEAKTIEEAFLSYESTSDGLVNSQLLREKKQDINNALTEFDGLDAEIQRLNGEIMGIAGVSSINGNTVAQQYDDSMQLINKMADDLEEKDSDLNANLDRLENRVQELKDAINDVAANFKTNTGFSDSRVKNIQTTDWYRAETTDVYDRMYADSPFSIDRAEDNYYVTEFGIESDAGTTVMGAAVGSYGAEMTRDGNTRTGNGYVTGLEGRIDAGGDYSEGSVQARAGYAGGEFEVDDHGFFAVEGEAGVARADANAMIGSEDWNVHAEGEAGAFTADGRVRADTGGIGVRGTASLFHAEGEAGATLAGTDIDFAVSAGQVGGGVELAWDKFEFEVHAGIGGRISVEFPW